MVCHEENFYWKIMIFEKSLNILLIKFGHFLKKCIFLTNDCLIFSIKNMFGLWETTGTFSRLTLTEITDDDKVFVKNNPQLFDKEFY